MSLLNDLNEALRQLEQQPNQILEQWGENPPPDITAKVQQFQADLPGIKSWTQDLAAKSAEAKGQLDAQIQEMLRKQQLALEPPPARSASELEAIPEQFEIDHSPKLTEIEGLIDSLLATVGFRAANRLREWRARPQRHDP